MTPVVVYKDTRESLRKQSIHCGRAIALDRTSFLLPNPPSTSVRTRVVLGVSGSPGDRLGSTCLRDFRRLHVFPRFGLSFLLPCAGELSCLLTPRARGGVAP